MNCRPGDLAVVFRTDGHGLAREAGAACIGHVVTVEYLRPPINETNCTANLVWKIKQSFVITVRGTAYSIVGVEDHCLKPIRGTGKKAADETLRELEAA